MKDWNKEGLKVAKAMRIFLPKTPRDKSSFWPGAFIGEGSPFTRTFSMRKPFPKNPYPLTFDRPNEDYYYFHTDVEARVPGIAMHLLLKRRWPCWWPAYGENYPVLRLFREKPKYPQKALVRLEGKATFSYDPWVHEGLRFAVDDILLSLSFFFDAAATEDLAPTARANGLGEDAIVKQHPHMDLVRLEGKATFSYDPWVHEGLGLATVDAVLGLRLWEFAANDFMENAPPMLDFSPLLRVPSMIYPKLFTLAQIMKLKEEYESQFEFYDPNIIVSRGGRPALEDKIINRIVPAIKALGWNNYPGPMHLRTCSALWKEAPYNWHNHPLDYQTWRTQHIEDWRLKKYFKKLKKNLRRAEIYTAKKRSQAASWLVWRDANLARWLAFVRDDPRQNTKGAKDDIISYNKDIAAWRQKSQDLRIYRGF